MSFNDGFSTQGIPFITGSNDGQVLTWDSINKQWAAGAGVGSISTTVSTSNGIVGDGTSGNTVRLDSSITVSNITVTNTASVAHLDTIYQQSLVVGDKYITLMSGANNHSLMDGAGILWGSGSTDPTTGDQKSVAYVLYRDDTKNQLEIFPGLNVSGSLSASNGISGSFIGDASQLINFSSNSIPALSASHVIYVSPEGDDNNIGSFNKPFNTIQAAINYASLFYNDQNEKVQIKLLPGIYAGFDITRRNMYFTSEYGNALQRAVTINSSVKITANGLGKTSDIYAFDGILFTQNSDDSEPLLHIQGTGSSGIYVQNCQLYTNSNNINANAIRIDGEYSQEKLFLRDCTLQSNKNGADLLKVLGGHIEIDSCRFYGNTTPGIGSAVSASGITSLQIDRALIENGSTSPAIKYSGSGLFTLTNSSITKGGSGNSIETQTASGSLLLNSFFALSGANASGATISGAGIYYSGLASIVPGVRVTVVGGTGLTELNGNIIASTVTASNGLYSPYINGVTGSDYAQKDKNNTYNLVNNFFGTTKLLGPTDIGDGTSLVPTVSFKNGSKLDISPLSRINSSGSINVAFTGFIQSYGNIKVTGSAYFSGSGEGLSNLSGAMWGPNNNFATDVRNQITGGIGITIVDGVISAEAFKGVVTGSNLTGSGKDETDPIKLIDNISLVSVSASSGFTGSLLGTASYAILAQNSLNANTASYLGNQPASAYARINSSNVFNGNQEITGTLRTSLSISGSSIAAGSFTGTTINVSQVSASTGFSGSGKNIVDLTGSNWSANGTSRTASFYTDVASAFSGTGIQINQLPDGRYELFAVIEGAGLKSDNSNILGTGIDGNEFRLNSSITASTFSASVGFTGSLSGTAENANKLGNYLASQYARLGSDGNLVNNTFYGAQVISGALSINNAFTAQEFIKSNSYISASGGFRGDGSQINNLTASNINNFSSSVRNVFTLGDGVGLSLDPLNPTKYKLTTDVGDSGLFSEGSITGSGKSDNRFRLKNDITASTFSASVGFTGSLLGTASYANLATNSTYISGASGQYSVSQIAKLTTDNTFNINNTFNGNSTFNGWLSSSAGLTGSFKGGNITATNISSSDGISGSFFGNYTGGPAQISWLSASNGITGSFYGGSITATSISSSNGISGSFFGKYTGGPAEISWLTASNGITGSFSGSGQLLNELTGTSFRDFAGDVRNQLSSGSRLDYVNGQFNVKDDISLTSVTASFSGSGEYIANLSASNWTGSITGFRTDVRNTFVAGEGIYISTQQPDGTYVITSSGGGAGGLNGVQLGPTEINLSGSGSVENPLTLKQDISLTSVSASFSGSGRLLNNLTGSGFRDFAGDVRSELSAGSRLDYVNGQFNVKNNILLTSVTASFNGSLNGSSVIANTISASSGISGSFTGSLATIQNITASNIASNYLSASIISGSHVNVDYLDFNTSSVAPSAQLGRMYYNQTTGDIATFLDSAGLLLNNGQQLVQKVMNPDNIISLAKGKIVHMSGSDNSNSDIPRVRLADWNNDNYSANTLGVVLSDTITPAGEGYIILAGVCGGIPLHPDNYDGGDILYLSSSGDFTKTKPVAPKHTVVIGQVVRTNINNGSIYVKIQNGYELSELHDVSSSNEQNGDLLVWDSSAGDSGLWRNSKTLNGDYSINGNLTSSTITASGIYVPMSYINQMYVQKAQESYTTIGGAMQTEANTFTSNDGLNISANVFKTPVDFDKKVEFNSEVTGWEDFFFAKNIRVNATASIAYLQSVNQTSLNIGEKHIIIVSGSTTETDLDEAGILWGSGSGPLEYGGSYGYIKYDVEHSHLHLSPGLYVTGALTSSENIYTDKSITGSSGFSGSVYYGNVFSGSEFTGSTGFSGSNLYATVITASNISGSTYIGNRLTTSYITASIAASSSLFTGLTASINQITASSHVSASVFYGAATGLTNINADAAKSTDIVISPDSLPATIDNGKFVSFSGSYLVTSSYNDTRTSNFIGVVKNKTGKLYTITVSGIASASNLGSYQGGDIIFVGTNGNASTYDSIPAGGYITQAGIASFDVAASGNILLQPRIFGQK